MCQALRTRGSGEVVSALGELMVECNQWRRTLPVVPKHQNETLALLRSKDPSSGVGSGHLCFVTSSPRASWLRPRFRKWGLLTPSGLCVAAGGLQPEGRWGGVPLGSRVGGERGPTGGAGRLPHCVKGSRRRAVAGGFRLSWWVLVPGAGHFYPLCSPLPPSD